MSSCFYASTSNADLPDVAHQHLQRTSNNNLLGPTGPGLSKRHIWS